MRRKHWVIPVANEMGYFPTSRQASAINGRLYDILPPAKKEFLFNDPDFQGALRTAIKDVMSGSLRIVRSR